MPRSDLRHWCWAVARLPHADWVRWRARSSEIQVTLGHPPTVDEIDAADLEAFRELVDAPTL